MNVDGGFAAVRLNPAYVKPTSGLPRVAIIVHGSIAVFRACGGHSPSYDSGNVARIPLRCILATENAVGVGWVKAVGRTQQICGIGAAGQRRVRAARLTHPTTTA